MKTSSWLLLIMFIFVVIVVGYLVFTFYAQNPRTTSSPSQTISESVTPSISQTPEVSQTPSVSPSNMPSATPSRTPSASPTPARTPSPTQTPSPTPTPIPSSSQTESVSISNFSFNPGVLTISVGDTVRWTNLDSASHTVSSATFSSPTLSTGQTYEFKFTQVGTFDYHCSIHPFMTGQIIVQ